MKVVSTDSFDQQIGIRKKGSDSMNWVTPLVI